eukprot:Phypoly_transcript_04818.p1 GENE.Phypoly_transcript_04818~~Phypoly_transcript_04818.p1  ORF type:complete len:617 (+),score=19.67 Phypoly_transcript_04818:230-2080(+)
MPEFTELYTFFLLHEFLVSAYDLQLKTVYRRGRNASKDHTFTPAQLQEKLNLDVKRHPSFERYIGWTWHAVHFKTCEFVWVLEYQTTDNIERVGIKWFFGTGACWIWVHKSFVDHHLFLIQNPMVVPSGYRQNLNMIFEFEDTDMVLCLCDCTTTINQVAYTIEPLSSPEMIEKYLGKIPDVFTEFANYCAYVNTQIEILSKKKQGPKTLGMLLSTKLYSLKVFGKGFGRYHSTEILHKIWISYGIPAMTSLKAIIRHRFIAIVLAIFITFLKSGIPSKRHYNPLIHDQRKIDQYRRQGLQVYGGSKKRKRIISHGVTVYTTQPFLSEDLVQSQNRKILNQASILGVGNADYSTSVDVASGLIPEIKCSTTLLPPECDFRSTHPSWNPALSSIPPSVFLEHTTCDIFRYCPLRTTEVPGKYELDIEPPLTWPLETFPTMEDIMKYVKVFPRYHAQVDVPSHVKVDPTEKKKRKRRKRYKQVPTPIVIEDEPISSVASILANEDSSQFTIKQEVRMEDYQVNCNINSTTKQEQVKKKRCQPNRYVRARRMQCKGTYARPMLEEVITILYCSHIESGSEQKKLHDSILGEVLDQARLTSRRVHRNIRISKKKTNHVCK